MTSCVRNPLRSTAPSRLEEVLNHHAGLEGDKITKLDPPMTISEYKDMEDRGNKMF